jgi:hypothetical protein
LQVGLFGGWSCMSEPSNKFRNAHILRVREPAEPDEVQWDNLEKSKFVRIFGEFLTTSLCLGLLLFSYFIQRYFARE